MDRAEVHQRTVLGCHLTSEDAQFARKAKEKQFARPERGAVPWAVYIEAKASVLGWAMRKDDGSGHPPIDLPNCLYHLFK